MPVQGGVKPSMSDPVAQAVADSDKRISKPVGKRKGGK